MTDNNFNRISDKVNFMIFLHTPSDSAACFHFICQSLYYSAVLCYYVVLFIDNGKIVRVLATERIQA